MCDQQSLRSACAYAQSDQSLEYSMYVKLLTEHHLELLGLEGGYTGSSESALVKMPHCWKSHVGAQLWGCYRQWAVSLQFLWTHMSGLNYGGAIGSGQCHFNSYGQTQ